MSTPEERRTAEQPAVEPSVSTAPAQGPTRSRWHPSRIPSHLGRARTSTVVLGVLFVAIYGLYLNVKPPAPGTAPASTTETGTVVPAPAPAPAPTSTEATPGPTTSAPRTTGAPTTTAEPEPTEEPTGPTGEETVEPTPLTTSAPSGGTSAPTEADPSG